MNQLKIFIELSRLNKPIGFMLLFWPCSWGLAYAFKYNQNLELFIYYLVLFTFLSKSLSTISLKIHPALLISTEPKKNNNK